MLRDQFGVVILILIAGVMVHFAVLDQHVSNAATNTDTGMVKLSLLVAQSLVGVTGDFAVLEQLAIDVVMDTATGGARNLLLLVVDNHAGGTVQFVVEEQHAKHAVMEIVGIGINFLPPVIDSDGEVCKFCDT